MVIKLDEKKIVIGATMNADVQSVCDRQPSCQLWNC